MVLGEFFFVFGQEILVVQLFAFRLLGLAELYDVFKGQIVYGVCQKNIRPPLGCGGAAYNIYYNKKQP